MYNAKDFIRKMVLSGKYMEINGPNRSPAIDTLCKKFGYALGSAWCSLFCVEGFWQAEHAGATGVHILKTASSQALLKWFKEQGKKEADPDYKWTSTDPQDLLSWEGALAIRTDPDKVHGHVTTVEFRYTTDGKVVAIGTEEGNTGPDQGSHGQGAYAHKRIIPLQPYAWTFCNTSKLAGGKWWKV